MAATKLYQPASAVKTDRQQALPTILFAEEVTSVAEATLVPDGGAFLVAAHWKPDGVSANDLLFTSGAIPNSIGWHNRPGALGEFYFEAPEVGDVVWSNVTNTLLRYERDGATGTLAWNPYRSMPQRALDGMPAIAMLDPDGIYEHFARMMGGFGATMSKDARTLKSLRSPDLVPEDLIASAAANIGADFDESSTPEQQRHALKISVPVGHVRGTVESTSLHLQTLGFSGTVFDRWTVSQFPLVCFDGKAANGTADNVNKWSVTPSDAVLRVFFSGMYGGDVGTPAQGCVWVRDDSPPRDGDTLTLGPLALPILQVVFKTTPTLPNHIQIGAGIDMMSALAAICAANSAINSAFWINANLVPAYPYNGIQPASAHRPGPPALDYAHGASGRNPDRYWPSRYVTVIYNYASGAPVYYPLTTEGRAQASADHNLLKQSLGINVLPIHCIPGFWGTDAPVESSLPVGSDPTAVVPKNAQVAVTETFSVTQV